VAGNNAAVLEALPLAAAALRARLQRATTVRDAPQAPPPAPLWTPLLGPQTMALESEADELYYGGGAGGGKSFLLVGYGLTRARFGIIFRRQFKQLLGPEGLLETSKTITGQPSAFNNSTLIWRLGERQLEFGAVDHEDDKFKYQGRAHDFKGFDEVAQFSESQYLYLAGWARTTAVGQRVRILACGNPPQNAEGEWVIQRWAPWLDEQHPNPAKPGELRWFVRTRQGNEIEVEGPGVVSMGDETLTPKSRTFIPARVQDNPYLMATGYLAQLQQMPEPLRSQLIYGDHTIGLQDDPWQLIPSAWVREAQARWQPNGAAGTPVTSIGIDVAQGGNDQTVIVRRHGRWFAQPEAIPGAEVPDANVNADHVTRALAQGGVAYIDADGIGSSTYFLARATLNDAVRAYHGGAPTEVKDASGVLGFFNVRAAAYWKLREALDPSSLQPIALPPSRELRVELCAARYNAEDRVVKLEKKEKIKERLGRSPDLADAVVMALWDDPRALRAGLYGLRSGSGR
jgi:hypothetical protein